MSTDYVKYGVWTDHSKNQEHWLVTDSWSGVITNFLAILITSTGGPLYKLFNHPLYLFWKKVWGSPPPSSTQDETNTEEMRDQALRAAADTARQRLQRGYQQVPTDTPTAINGPNKLARLWGLVFMLLLLFVPKVALVVASVVSSRLATVKIAISSDPSCGEYEFDFDSQSSSVPFLRYERPAESLAAQYAQKCYGNTSVATECNKFYSQNISYTKIDNASCPFDGNVCEGGRNEAFRITTDLLSGALLGINARNPYFFERTTTCSPMIAGDKYVKVGISDRKEDQWEYWYGEALTWANPVKKSSWAIKGYSMGVEWFDPADSINDFNPLLGFRAGSYPITLMFISSHSIVYPQYRNDPVFPAHTKAKFPPGYIGPTYYYNNSTRAGVLGCVDEYRICRTRSGPCWNNKNITSIPSPPNNRNATEEENVAKLLTLALDFSTSYGSVQYRQAEALDAQAKLSDTQSLPLAPKQWQVEAESIFQTSLARMQSNVYDIVRGTAANFKGYQNVLEPKHKGICELVKIPTLGWTNITFWDGMSTFLGVVFLWIISVRVDSYLEAYWFIFGCCIPLHYQRQAGAASHDMLAVVLWWKAFVPALWWLFTLVKWTWRCSEPLRHWVDVNVLYPASQKLPDCMGC